MPVTFSCNHPTLPWAWQGQVAWEASQLGQIMSEWALPLKTQIRSLTGHCRLGPLAAISYLPVLFLSIHFILVKKELSE
jgi:hypothetical protein